MYEVSESVMAAVCEAKSPPGVAAICRIPAPPEKVPAGGPILLLDGVQDPGNVGALIRTADAAGAVAVVIGGGSADPWGAKAVRSSEGSVFHLAVMEGRDLETRVRELKQDGIPVLATALDRGTWVSQADSRQCFALIVGSEARGVSDKLICLADAVLRIPMRGKAESLNVAVAAGIALFHVTGLTRPG
ncbi:RNA methyltransferase [Candidatus Poribacteria bacterium]|nr:RNA methyltransferase [Candidatus Poribacteria bacterium]